MKIVVPVDKLSLSDRVLIQAALPRGYTLAGGRNGQLEVYRGENKIARVSVLPDGDVVFEERTVPGEVEKDPTGAALLFDEFKKKLNVS